MLIVFSRPHNDMIIQAISMKQVQYLLKTVPGNRLSSDILVLFLHVHIVLYCKVVSSYLKF